MFSNSPKAYARHTLADGRGRSKCGNQGKREDFDAAGGRMARPAVARWGWRV